MEVPSVHVQTAVPLKFARALHVWAMLLPLSITAWAWNPLAGTQEERTLPINPSGRIVECRIAAQRSVTVRKSIAEDGNPWGASGDKIAMFGEGTGGYITLASSTISDYNDIILDDAGNPITKFWYNPGDGSFMSNGD